MKESDLQLINPQDYMMKIFPIIRKNQQILLVKNKITILYKFLKQIIPTHIPTPTEAEKSHLSQLIIHIIPLHFSKENIRPRLKLNKVTKPAIKAHQQTSQLDTHSKMSPNSKNPKPTTSQ